MQSSFMNGINIQAVNKSQWELTTSEYGLADPPKCFVLFFILQGWLSPYPDLWANYRSAVLALTKWVTPVQSKYAKQAPLHQLGQTENKQLICLPSKYTLFLIYPFWRHLTGLRAHRVHPSYALTMAPCKRSLQVSSMFWSDMLLKRFPHSSSFILYSNPWSSSVLKYALLVVQCAYLNNTSTKAQQKAEEATGISYAICLITEKHPAVKFTDA